MKVTLPSRVPITWLLSFALGMLALELVEGTSILMALIANAFIVVAGLAFNQAGGLQYPSGAYICFNALLSGLIGMIGKVTLGEPLQSNLLAPERTMTVYLVSMGVMYGAALVTSTLRRPTGILQDTLAGVDTNQIAAGCYLLATLPQYVLPVSVIATFIQFNYFGILAIMLPVYQRARMTDGRSSFSRVSLFVWAYLTIKFGIFEFSKEGMFAPTVAWAAAALAAGYRITVRKAVVLAVTVIPAVMILTPFSQIGRNYRGTADLTPVIIELLTHPSRTRQLYEEDALWTQLSTVSFHWFNKPQGLMDRLTLAPVDDALIYVTDHGHKGTTETFKSYLLNAIPRYVYPNKPMLHVGNDYAHEVGLLADDDASTSVSFTGMADGYHQAHWYGVTLLAGSLYVVLFLVCDSVTGPVGRCRWALIYILWFSHLGAEGMLNAPVYGATTLTLAVLVAYMVATRFAPLLGALLTLPQKEFLKTRGAVLPGRGLPVQSS